MQKIQKKEDIYLIPSDHQSTLIWMHGLGDSALGWVNAFLQNSPLPPTMKVVLLTAPTVPVTLNMGM